jgi:hypothetical protein
LAGLRIQWFSSGKYRNWLDAAALQRGERGDALLDRHAVVLLAVDHQHRHPPLGDVVDRVERS